MAGWNGSGTFSRTHNWTQDQGNGILIRADRHDANDTDFVNGINNCVTKDGQNSPSADLPMATYKHTGVGNATARNQYSAVGQIQDQSFIWCGTAGGTANALTLTPSPAITAYAAGQSFVFKAGSSSNSSTATVTISGVASPPAIQFNGSALSGGEIQANKFYRITLDTTSTAQLERISGLDFGAVDLTTAQTLTNKSLSDSTTFIIDNSDATKKAQFQCSSITTGTTRTYTWPDKDGTVAMTSDVTSASSQTTSNTPTGVASASGTVMMGIAASITPVKSGTVCVYVSGAHTNSSGANINTFQIRYGTGTAPTNGAAATGTAMGISTDLHAINGGSYTSLSLVARVSGLSLNTAYWIDLTMATNGGTLTPADICIVAIES